MTRNEFLNAQRVAWLSDSLARVPNPARAHALRFQLANEQLRAGQTEAAIAGFKELEATFAEAPADLRLIRQRLAVAYLRLGEQENCLLNHQAASCLMPIQPPGFHTAPRGSRTAIGYLEPLLAQEATLQAQWLLNLAYMTLGTYPDSVPAQWLIPPDVFASEADLPPFPDVAPALGVDHTALSGSVIAEDFDGDGYLDLLTSSWGLTDPMRYYHNNADGTFTDRTREAGLADQRGGLHMVQADYDNDGDADVLVLRGAWLGVYGQDQGRHPNTLLRNDGGRFTDVTRAAGMLESQPTQTAAWADYDADGHLDLFIGYESSLDPDDPRTVNAYRCKLYRNLGNGTFQDVAPEVGLDHIGFVKGVAWGDYDNDGLPDLYLSHHGQLNVLFHNDGVQSDGTWRFSNTTAEAGVAHPRLSFPTWFWDYDHDGWLDLFVAGYENYRTDALDAVVTDYLGGPKATYSRLYRNNRDGTFTDVTVPQHMDAVLLAMGAGFGDLDNDGYLDAYFGTGQPALTTLVPNRMFRNNAGQGFQDVTTAGGFGHIQKGHGITFADLDNDGDQDLYAVMGGAYSGDVYPNALFLNPGLGHHWMVLVLEGGNGTNRWANGARIRLVLDAHEGGREIHRVLGRSSSFGNLPRRLEIGVGKATNIALLEIIWPDRARTTQRFTDLEVNQALRLIQGKPHPEVIPLQPLDFKGDAPAHQH